MDDHEPTLKEIGDYDTLRGEKKRIVWIVILSGLLIGAVLVGARLYYADADDAILVEESIGKVPMK